MNTELLERLLVDRAFGQLSPDVAALLSEHLATHPEEEKLAGELAEIVALAGAALKRPIRIAAVPTPIPALLWRQRAHYWLAMAASFALGVSAMLLGLRATPSQRPGNVAHQGLLQEPAVEQMRHAPEVDRAVQALPFWSNRRIYVLAASARQATPGRNIR